MKAERECYGAEEIGFDNFPEYATLKKISMDGMILDRICRYRKRELCVQIHKSFWILLRCI